MPVVSSVIVIVSVKCLNSMPMRNGVKFHLVNWGQENNIQVGNRVSKIYHEKYKAPDISHINDNILIYSLTTINEYTYLYQYYVLGMLLIVQQK